MKKTGLLIKRGVKMSRIIISQHSINMFSVVLKMLNKYIRARKIKQIKAQAFERREWHRNFVQEMEEVLPQVFK